MAIISITRVGDRVSINLDCADDDEAETTFYTLMSRWLDNETIEIAPIDTRRRSRAAGGLDPGQRL